MELEAVIGLEIHVQTSTKTKMFCRCSNDSWEVAPNVNVCPICMGFPGQLPVINDKAVEKGVKTALALNCKIAEVSKFDRKNYFYPDLPSGFQISQYDEPISYDGWVEVEVGAKSGSNDKDASEKKRIGITRLHLENDAGKLTHVRNGSLVDFNRAGTPLMEIVSEPDMRNAEEAAAYAREVQKIVRYIGSSDADMEKGMMRFDASVSLRQAGSDELNPRAEIKNLNSFKALEAAIKYEIKRQKKLWETGEQMEGAITVGWNDEKGQTYFMRGKEDSDEYRYFPEPDLPVVVVNQEMLAGYRAELPELPGVKRERYISELGLNPDDARILSEDLALAQYFEAVVAGGASVKRAVSFINTILMKHLNEELIGIGEQKVTAEMMAELIKLVDSGEISNNVAKGEVFEAMYESGRSAGEIVEEKSLKQVSDSGAIKAACKKVIEENPGPVEDIRGGKDKAIGFLVGMVMKEMKGKANPAMVNETLRGLI